MGESIAVRRTRREDFAAIVALSAAVYPWTEPYTEAELSSQLAVFPEGQLVAVDLNRDEVVGMAASFIVDWSDHDLESSWHEITDAARFTAHDPEGRTLYGAEVMVRPDRQGEGIGSRLYAARRELVRRLDLVRIRARARLRGYGRYADRMTPKEYVEAVIAEEIVGPTLSFQLQQGFEVIGVVSDYLPRDPASHGHAAIIEWVNAEVGR